MSDTPGTVRDLRSGRVCGKTASLEETFVEQARARSAEARVYAVVGPDSSDGFVARLREVLPVVVDDDARGVALLIDGDPAEWGVDAS